MQIEAVHQPVRPELLLGQFAGEAAGDLIAELVDARADEGGVEFVVTRTCQLLRRGALEPVRRLALRLLAEIAPHRRPRGADRLAQRLRHVMAAAQFEVDPVGVDDFIGGGALRRLLQRGGLRLRIADDSALMEILAPAACGGQKHDEPIAQAIGGDHSVHDPKAFRSVSTSARSMAPARAGVKRGAIYVADPENTIFRWNIVR